MARPLDSSRSAPIQLVDRSADVDPLLTSDEVAKLLKCSRSFVHSLRRSGELPAVVIGQRKILFRRRDVAALIGGV